MTVNGAAVAVQNASINGSRVTLSLSGLAAGDRIGVSWSGVKSAAGQSLFGSTSLSAG